VDDVRIDRALVDELGRIRSSETVASTIKLTESLGLGTLAGVLS
jgi:EAL domain-containing protein (putative c-di-GMP-specific phosphodiesterase class I)